MLFATTIERAVMEPKEYPRIMSSVDQTTQELNELKIDLTSAHPQKSFLNMGRLFSFKRFHNKDTSDTFQKYSKELSGEGPPPDTKKVRRVRSNHKAAKIRTDSFELSPLPDPATIPSPRDKGSQEKNVSFEESSESYRSCQKSKRGSLIRKQSAPASSTKKWASQKVVTTIADMQQLIKEEQAKNTSCTKEQTEVLFSSICQLSEKNIDQALKCLASFANVKDLIEALQGCRSYIKSLSPSTRSEILSRVTARLQNKASPKDLTRTDMYLNFFLFLQSIELELLCKSAIDFVSGSENLFSNPYVKEHNRFVIDMTKEAIHAFGGPTRLALVEQVSTVLEGKQRILPKDFTRSNDPYLHLLFLLRTIEIETMFGPFSFIKPAIDSIPDFVHRPDQALHKHFVSYNLEESFTKPAIIASLNLYFRNMYEHMKTYFRFTYSFETIQTTFLKLYRVHGTSDEEAEKTMLIDFFFRTVLAELSQLGNMFRNSSTASVAVLGEECVVLARIFQKIITEFQEASELTLSIPIGWTQNYIKIRKLILGQQVNSTPPTPLKQSLNVSASSSEHDN